MWTLHWGQCATPLLGSASTASTIPWALNAISAYLGSTETQPLVFPAEVMFLDNQVSNKAHLLHSRSKQSHTLVTHKWQIKPHIFYTQVAWTPLLALSLSLPLHSHILYSWRKGEGGWDPCSFSFPPIPSTLTSLVFLPPSSSLPSHVPSPSLQFPPLSSLVFLPPSSSLPSRVPSPSPQFSSLLSLGFLSPSSSLPRSLSVQS